MSNFVKLKKNSFLIVAAIIIIGATFYGQTHTEGFEKKYNYVGYLIYGNLKDGIFTTDPNLAPGSTIINASDGRIIWKNGDPKPKLSDRKFYYMSINSNDNIMTYKEIKYHENMMREGEPTPNAEYVYPLFLTGKRFSDINARTDKEYADFFRKDIVKFLKDAKITDIDGNNPREYTRFLGMNILKRTRSLIIGGVFSIIFLTIVFIIYRKFFNKIANISSGR